jgi:hypothetical protein
MALSYEIMVNRFTEFGCTLLTTKEEYEIDNMNTKSVYKFLATCGHENTSHFTSLKKQPDKKCKMCIRVKNQIIVYERICSRFANMGMQVVTTKDEFVREEMNIDSFMNITMQCGHVRFTRWADMQQSDYKLCKECTMDKYIENQRISHEEISRRFAEHGLKLVTTKEEYESNAMQLSDKITYIARCGHERTCRVGSVIRFEIFNCEDCAKASVSPKMKEKAKTEDGIASGNMLEYQALCQLRENVGNVLEVRKLGTGTLADCVVRPLGSYEDKWLPIQLKSTKMKHKSNEYKFDIKDNDYTGILVLCTCVDDKRYFLYQGHELKGRNMHISLRKNNKPENELEKDQLAIALLRYYMDGNMNNCFGLFNIPQCPSHKREKEFIDHRENGLPMIKFEYNDIDNLVYDFKVNGLKVQEKVCHITKKNERAIMTIVTKNHYRIGKKSIKGPYAEGDNDLYWFHHPDKKSFYVIPESLMIKWEKLSNEDNEGRRSIIFYPYHDTHELENKMTKEANYYLFFYENLDIRKLKSLFNLDTDGGIEATN